MARGLRPHYAPIGHNLVARAETDSGLQARCFCGECWFWVTVDGKRDTGEMPSTAGGTKKQLEGIVFYLCSVYIDVRSRTWTFLHYMRTLFLMAALALTG